MKYYTIRKGIQTGIFHSREECKKFVLGYPGAKYKAFESKQEAENAYQEGYTKYYQSGSKLYKRKDYVNEINIDTIAVDAACANNPGVMEYKGIDISTGQELFYQRFDTGTNNIGEFLAIIHALSYINRHGLQKDIYSDSKNAINRVKNKKCKTKLQQNKETKELFQIIKKAEIRLQEYMRDCEIIKRNTKKRGEIPADFGRK